MVGGLNINKDGGVYHGFTMIAKWRILADMNIITINVHLAAYRCVNPTKLCD